MSLQAQELGKIQYRVEVGGTLSKISSLGVDHNGDKGKGFLGIRVGGNVVMPFENTIFSFNPGLYLISRGEKQANVLEGEKPAKIETYALQIPLELSFRLATIAEKHRIYLNVDPYLAVGLSAKISRGGDEVFRLGNLKPTSYDLYENKYFKRFDFGVGANLMYQYKKFHLRGGIEASVLGQVKGSPNPGEAYFASGTSRFITSYIGVGYQF